MSLTFGIVGGGWRSEFFLRIARDMPELFPLAGIVVRNPEKAKRLKEAWAVPIFATVEELLAKGQPSFAVTSVSWASNLPLLEYLAGQKMPVLSETPIGTSLEDLYRVFNLAESGARIQVAEQYLFQPLHAARLKLVEDGRLGTIYEADVSVAHGYHGISLLRNYLQTGFRLPKITARKFKSRIVEGPGRAGVPSERSIVDSERTIAQFDYGDRLGIFDFTREQYFSWIRSARLMVRGEEGEILDSQVRLLKDFQTPINYSLTRQDTGHYGNLEGYYNQAILGGGEILYQNPFKGARWSDDEIAVATSLLKMKEYVEDGKPFYSVGEACQDRYLDLIVAESISRSETITTSTQSWTPKE